MTKQNNQPPQTTRPLGAPRKRTKGRDALTTEERNAPYTDDPALLARERAAADDLPDQLPLFVPGPHGAFAPMLGGLPVLEAESSLELARAWYRRELEQAKRPPNTVESYCYDLVILEKQIGSIPIK